MFSAIKAAVFKLLWICRLASTCWCSSFNFCKHADAQLSVVVHSLTALLWPSGTCCCQWRASPSSLQTFKSQLIFTIQYSTAWLLLPVSYPLYITCVHVCVRTWMQHGVRDWIICYWLAICSQVQRYCYSNQRQQKHVCTDLAHFTFRLQRGVWPGVQQQELRWWIPHPARNLTHSLHGLYAPKIALWQDPNTQKVKMNTIY